MQTFLDKRADTDLELDMGLTANGLPVTNGNAKRMRKSASESALTMKNSKRDSPLSSLFGISEKTAEITYEWVGTLYHLYF